MSISFYELSRPAAINLSEIYDYVKAYSGEEQAEEYLLNLEMVFELIVQNPQMGRLREEIRAGLRSLPKAKHIIFYRLLPDRVRIIRVLHGRQDLTRLID